MLFNLELLVSVFLPVAVFRAAAQPAEHLAKRDQTNGIDVSSRRPNLDWTTVADGGNYFAYIEATEGSEGGNPFFFSQSSNAKGAGLIIGAYHLFRPDQSSGAAQANYFTSNGGKWTNNNNTLPGALYITAAPDGATCYGMKAPELVSSIQDFSDTYHSDTGRYPVTRVTLGWWETCTNNYPGFGDSNPLWIAGSGGGLPSAWSEYTFQQDREPGPYGGNDLFNGDLSALKSFANN